MAPTASDNPPEGEGLGDAATANVGWRRRRFWLLVGLVVGAALLRLPLLDRPIWFDEACMSSQRIGTWSQMLATLYVDIHPPLFVVFMHLWNGWFGDGEVVMRLPALLTGLACIPLTWWTGSRLVGERAALWAAVLLALSPVHVWYSAEARLYSPMVCCSLIAFGTFVRLLAPDGERRRGLYGVHLFNVAVMLALHYYLALYVVALGMLAPWVAGGLTRRAKGIVLWHAVGVALLVGFVLAKQHLGEFETRQDYLGALDLRGLFGFVVGWSWTGNTMESADSAVLRSLGHGFRWLGVGLLLLGCIHIARRSRTRPLGWLVLVGLFTLPGFLLACAAVGLDSTYVERSLIPALPFVLLLAGAGVTMLRGKVQWAVGLVTTVLAAISLVTLYGAHDSRWTVYKPNPDWRSAAAWLGEEIDRGAAGRPVFTSMPNPRSLSYYDARIQDAKNLQASVSAEEIGRKVEGRMGSWLGGLARDTFADLQAHNNRLLREAKLVVRRSRPSPAELEWPTQRPDDICYIVRNHWHPHESVDGSVERLLEHPQVELLHTERFTGVSVYKVRITR